MSTRLDYLVRKLGDLDDAIAREKTEYDKARDRYDKMRSRDILNELFDQLKGYRTEHDQLRRSNSAQATPRPKKTPHHQQHHASPRHGAPAQNAQRNQQQAPPPPQYRTAQPNRSNPQRQYPDPRGNNYGADNTSAGRPRGQPTNSRSESSNQKSHPPRPRQRTQIVDYEIEEPDGKSYIVRGGAVVRDFDPARDKVRKAE